MSTLHTTSTRQQRILDKAIIHSTDSTTPGVLCCVQYAGALRVEAWCRTRCTPVQWKCPQWRHRNDRILISLEYYLREAGGIAAKKKGAYRPWAHWGVGVGGEDNALRAIDDRLAQLARRQHVGEGVACSAAVSVLRRGHSSFATGAGLWASENVLRMVTAASPTLLSRVLLMAETNFTRNEMLNINQHTWAVDN